MTQDRIKGIGRILGPVTESAHENPDLRLVRLVIVTNHPKFDTKYEVTNYMKYFKELLDNDSITSSGLAGCKVSFEGRAIGRIADSGLPEIALTALKIID